MFEELSVLTHLFTKISDGKAGWMDVALLMGFVWFVSSKFLAKLGSIEKAIQDLGQKIVQIETIHKGRMDVQDLKILDLSEDTEEIKERVNILSKQLGTK